MTDVKASTECFIAGISAMNKVKDAESLIDEGKLDDAKTVIAEAMSYSKSGCLDENLSGKIEETLNEALDKIEDNDIDKAKESLISIANISID